MRRLIKKIIVWALGFEPSREHKVNWKAYIDLGDGRNSEQITLISEFPPNRISLPIINGIEVKDGDFPTEQEFCVYSLKTTIPSAKLAFYKI